MRLTSEERVEISNRAAFRSGAEVCSYVESLLAKREAFVQAATLEMAAKALDDGTNVCIAYSDALAAIRALSTTDCLAELRKQWEAERARILKIAEVFAARVEEREPAWFREKPGETDFADANAALLRETGRELKR